MESEVDTSIAEDLYVKCRTFKMVPYDKSLMFGKSSLLADASLVHGREFNTRWSNSLTFAHSGCTIGRTTGETIKLNPTIFATRNQQKPSLFGFSNMDVHIEQVAMDTKEGMKQFMEVNLD